jgi:hypothetical protein
MPPNGLELSCPAEAGRLPLIVAHAGRPSAPPCAPARRVSFSELLGSLHAQGDRSVNVNVRSIC